MNEPTPLIARLELRPWRVTAVLAALVGLLAVASLVAHIAALRDPSGARPWVKAFDLDEGDVPAFVAGGTFLLAAALLVVISLGKVGDAGPREEPLSPECRGEGEAPAGTVVGLRWRWRAMALAFLLLSFDRAAALHAIVPWAAVRQRAWLLHPLIVLGVVSGIAAVVIVVPLLLRLPRRTAVEFVIAGVLFAAGVVGVQPFEASYAATGRAHTLSCGLLTDTEELLELLGTVVFIHALLAYLARARAEVRITVDRRLAVS